MDKFVKDAFEQALRSSHRVSTIKNAFEMVHDFAVESALRSLPHDEVQNFLLPFLQDESRFNTLINVCLSFFTMGYTIGERSNENS